MQQEDESGVDVGFHEMGYRSQWVSGAGVQITMTLVIQVGLSLNEGAVRCGGLGWEIWGCE